MELNCPLQLVAALPIAWRGMAGVCFILAVAAAVLYRASREAVLWRPFLLTLLMLQQAILGVMEEGNQIKFPSRLPLLFPVRKIILNVIYNCS